MIQERGPFRKSSGKFRKNYSFLYTKNSFFKKIKIS